MSWVPLHPEAAPKGATPAVTLTVSTRKGPNRLRQRMTLTIRSRMIEGLGDWCAPGGQLCVARGAGEHDGMLRLGAGGVWRFTKPSGAIRAASVILPPPAGAPEEGCRQVPVAFRHGPDWIEVTLPDWARAGPRSVEGPQRQADDTRPSGGLRAPSPGRGRYVGISERVPDPAKTIQAADGGRVR